MATTNQTHVNFVKVPTMAKFNDITTKIDGTIYFIVDAKKIHLDGVMYGFNDSDVANQFVKLTGDTMTGDLTIGDTAVRSTIIGDESIKFNHTGEMFGEIKRTPGSIAGLEIVVGDTSFIFREGRFFGTQGEEQGPVKISGVADPVSSGDAVNKWYLDNHVINKIGAANGIASLDNTGKVPSNQLPSYVDDVLEYSNKASFPAAGESGKLYIDLSNNNVWRWGGSAYVNVSDGNAHLTLGTTASTAYRGDYGNAAYTHSLLETGNPHKVTKSDVGLGSVYNYTTATKAEAEAGTLTNRYMTPLNTKQAIEKLAPRLTWKVVA